MNELDNLTTGKAVDVLLNYETVKLFNNEQLEVDQYDAYLLGFQARSLPVTCLSYLTVTHDVLPTSGSQVRFGAVMPYSCICS